MENEVTDGRTLGFPQDWYGQFLHSLMCNPDAERLRERILPRCELRCLGIFLMLYAPNLPDFANARKRRGKVARRKLRERARALQARIAVAHGARADLTQELDNAKAALRRAPHAFSAKRLGVSGNHFMLFIVREYLRCRSGVEPKPADMAALATAGRYATGRWKLLDAVDPEAVSRNLRDFERNNPVLCLRVRGARSVPLIEAMPALLPFHLPSIPSDAVS
jgi:hypothetical protein